MGSFKQDARRNAELKRLRGLFQTLPENEQQFIEPLLENAAFLRVALDNLEAEVNREGATDEWANSATQYGRKVSASIQAYNQTAKIYHQLMKQLQERLPKGQQRDTLRTFEEMLEGVE